MVITEVAILSGCQVFGFTSITHQVQYQLTPTKGMAKFEKKTGMDR